MSWSDIYLYPNQRRAARLVMERVLGQDMYRVKGMNLDGTEWSEIPSDREVNLWLTLNRCRNASALLRKKMRSANG